MSKKLFVLMIVVVVVGTICISTYITSAAPQGPRQAILDARRKTGRKRQR